jgi:hypothetical protein
MILCLRMGRQLFYLAMVDLDGGNEPSRSMTILLGGCGLLPLHGCLARHCPERGMIMNFRKFVESLSEPEKDELLRVLVVGVSSTHNRKLLVYEIVYRPLAAEEDGNVERYIKAIKLIRECFNIGLKDAKNILDSRQLRTYSDENFIVNGNDYRDLLLEQGWELHLFFDSDRVCCVSARR